MLTLVLLSLTSQIGSPHGVRLLDDAPLLAQIAPPLLPVDGAPATEAPLSDAQVSAQQLQVDIDALKKSRPALGGGIALVSAGGTTALLGALYLAVSGIAGGAFAGGINLFVVIGAVGLGIGLPLVAIGVWLLYNRLEERKRSDDEIGRLKGQLQQKQLQQRQQGPGNPAAPPPMDVPSPQVRAPDAAMLIASF